MRNALLGAAVIAGISFVAAGQARADGDAAAGAIVFKQCAICHSPVQGQNKIGPSLWGVVGRHSASIPNFQYSAAMKAADKTWDPATLDTYLTKPSAMVPGTKMTFAGLSNPTDRANVIAYLETLK